MIETKRLNIMGAKKSDIEMIMQLENHADNRKYLFVSTYEEHVAKIIDENSLLLVLKEKDTKEVIGYALVSLDIKSEVFELRRIAVSKKELGYGRETMEALIKYAFEERNMNRFWLDVFPDNKRGMSLYNSLGMHCDGILRQSYKSEKGYQDQIIYSIIKDDYFGIALHLCKVKYQKKKEQRNG